MTFPTTFQGFANALIAPKVVNGVTYVPRITIGPKDGLFQSFFTPRPFSRTHGGIDLLYGALRANGTVDPVISTDTLNAGVSVRAPWAGRLEIEKNMARLIRDDGVELFLLHMKDLAVPLSGTRVEPGTA